MDMVERVARAILAAHDWTTNDGAAGGWDTLTADWQECFRRQARSAIDAMREPTDDMEAAGWEQLPDHPDDWSPVSAYTRMIDAALVPSPPLGEE
jgi:hypothetical protein